MTSDHGRAIVDVQSPLIQGLACAALQPGLRSVLVFDSGPQALRSAAAVWTEMLKVTSDRTVEQITLGTTESEEVLWGNFALQSSAAGDSFEWKPGLLGDGDPSVLRVVVIPDLTRLNLSSARACMMLMGSEVAQVERHGYQSQWRSQFYWIAGCARDEVGMVSPHLLDRFALRLPGQDVQLPDRTDALSAWFADLDSLPEELSILSPELCDRLRRAMTVQPTIGAAAYEQVLAYFSEESGVGMRRELALMRLVQAQAQFENRSDISIREVDRSAKGLGLTLKTVPQPKAPDRPELPASEPIDPPETPTPIPTPTRSETPTPVPSKPEVYRSDSEETLPPVALADEPRENPYPEDEAALQREFASLRLPPRRFRSTKGGRGSIIGVEPATVPQDIAWASTLLEAAKYQGIRRGRSDQGLVVRSSDLRRYRRAIVPEQMLLLVLDYTCLKDCQWQRAVLPYLQWAYVERATVCLVQVGAADAMAELQAQRISGQSVLVPRIRSGLEVGAGRATPLAHGLDLACQTLRHALQHGRNGVQRAVLIVVSDGRGNVPLEASRLNQKPTQPVKRRGIEDALAIASDIQRLNQVEAIVLNPQPKYYADLPVKLAQALGATIADIPKQYDWEVEP